MPDYNYDIDSDSTNTVANTVDVLGLDDIDVDLSFDADAKGALELDVKPLSTESRLAIDPLRTSSDLTLDLKPAVVDACLTLNVGKVPTVCIRQPYEHNIGFSWFGIEIWKYTFHGQQDTIVEEVKPKPAVAWGAKSMGGSPAEEPRGRRAGRPSREVGGLRVRLGD